MLFQQNFWRFCPAIISLIQISADNLFFRPSGFFFNSDWGSAVWQVDNHTDRQTDRHTDGRSHLHSNAGKKTTQAGRANKTAETRKSETWSRADYMLSDLPQTDGFTSQSCYIRLRLQLSSLSVCCLSVHLFSTIHAAVHTSGVGRKLYYIVATSNECRLTLYRPSATVQ